MLIISVFAICVSILGCVESKETATVDCSIALNQVILHPHPTNCSQYLQCVHGSPMARPCAPGTEFSPSIGVCVHSWQSDCTAGRESDVAETITEPTGIEIDTVTTQKDKQEYVDENCESSAEVKDIPDTPGNNEESDINDKESENQPEKSQSDKISEEPAVSEQSSTTVRSEETSPAAEFNVTEESEKSDTTKPSEEYVTSNKTTEQPAVTEKLNATVQAEEIATAAELNTTEAIETSDTSTDAKESQAFNKGYGYPKRFEAYDPNDLCGDGGARLPINLNSDCHHFVICTAGIPISLRCPLGQYFESDIGQCTQGEDKCND